MNLYLLIPLICLVLGLAAYFTPGNPKRQRCGGILAVVALVVLALVFLGGHWPHLLGRWSL
jgi:hypothetical protein